MYCTLCAAPLRPEPNDCDYVDGNLHWLGNIIGINSHDAEISLVGFHYNYSLGFEKENNSCNDGDVSCGSDDDVDSDGLIKSEFHGKTAYRYDLNDGAAFGIIVHSSCHELLKTAGLLLPYEDLWNMISEDDRQASELVRDNTYSGMTKYTGQDFDWKSLMADGNIWMVQDPMTNDRNRCRLLQIWQTAPNKNHE